MRKLLIMFLSFFKIGAFTFGGGYAMIPLIEREVVDSQKWISKDEFTDILVIAQSFPGAMAVNTCLFIGYKIAGIIGAVVALLSVVIPSFLIILLIASYFYNFRDIPTVDRIFKGITRAVPVLVLIAVQSLSKSIKRSTANIVIIIICTVSISILNVHPIIMILLSALYGTFLSERGVYQNEDTH